MTHSPQRLRELLDSHGLAPRRERGQNFVGDPNTVRRIAALAGVGPGDRVIEVGPGLGSLTLALAETGADVIAVEVDSGLTAALRTVLAEHIESGSIAPDRVSVIHADAMALDWSRDWTHDPQSNAGRSIDHRDDEPPESSESPQRAQAPEPSKGSVSVVANLPYNIATPLIADLLDTAPWIDRFLVMIQREVAERLTASVHSSAYGAISIKVAYWADARIVGQVPASVFIPRPRVDSSLVEIVRHRVDPLAPEPGPLFDLIRRAFSQRRKMLRRSLAGVIDDEIFTAAGVEPTARPQDLDLAEWCALTSTWLAQIDHDPTAP